MKRSKSDRIIGGVCSGIADELGWESWFVRFILLILTFTSIGFPGGLVYLIAWMVMPEE